MISHHMKTQLMILTAFACVSLTNAAEDLSKGLLLVANKGDHTLGLIDTVAGKMIATVPEDGVTGHEVVASPDGKFAYVPIYGNAGVGRAGTDGQLIRVIDLEKRAVSGTIDLGQGIRPRCRRSERRQIFRPATPRLHGPSRRPPARWRSSSPRRCQSSRACDRPCWQRAKFLCSYLRRHW